MKKNRDRPQSWCVRWGFTLRNDWGCEVASQSTFKNVLKTLGAISVRMTFHEASTPQLPGVALWLGSN